MRRVVSVVAFAAAVVLLRPPIQTALATKPHFVPLGIDPTVVAAEPAGNVAAKGTIKDRSGRPSGATIALVAWPSAEVNATLEIGDAVETPTVGWARANPDGSFSVKLDAKRLTKSYKARDGRVNLEAVAWDGEQMGRWSFTTELDAAGVATNPATIDMSLKGKMDPAQTVRVPGPDSAFAAIPLCYWLLKSTYDPWTVIGASWPYGYDTGWMSVTSSTKQILGVAVGFKADGVPISWSAGGTSSVDSGSTSTWAESIAYRDYRIQHRYGNFNFQCPMAPPSRDWNSHEIKSLPYTTTGSMSQPTWNYCGLHSAGLWSRYQTNGDAWKASGGVKSSIGIGIDLSAEVNYSSGHQLFYRLVANGKLCGDTDDPDLSRNAKTSR